MNDSLTTIKFHGDLGKSLPRDTWRLAVKTVGEAINAVEQQTKILYKKLIENDQKNIRYRVLINGKDFVRDSEKDMESLEGVQSCELVMNRDIDTIDVIPVIEGAGDSGIVETIIGAVLIVVGIILYTGGMPVLGTAFIMAGIGLMAAGIANLLTPMPEFDDFRQIEGGGRPSYLFTGPSNTIREGGPVFVGYGKLLIGSQVIQSSVETKDELNGNYMNKAADKMTFVPWKKYWGNEHYGLDYGNDFKGNIKGDSAMAQRAAIVSKQTGEPDSCDPTTEYVGDSGPGTSYLVSNGSDYVIQRKDEQ